SRCYPECDSTCKQYCVRSAIPDECYSSCSRICQNFGCTMTAQSCLALCDESCLNRCVTILNAEDCQPYCRQTCQRTCLITSQLLVPCQYQALSDTVSDAASKCRCQPGYTPCSSQLCCAKKA
uniref:Cysteine rich repeat-containing domain protein n=1 Tax=Syphacia muris TaxID=451379 RepID=A0A0N5B035_9BILA